MILLSLDMERLGGKQLGMLNWLIRSGLLSMGKL